MVKMLLPRVTARAFFEVDEFHEQMEEVRNYWKNILEGIGSYGVSWYTEKNSFYILSPSMEPEYDYRITFFDNKGIPVSHSIYKKKDVGNGGYNDILYDLPYSTKTEDRFIEIEYVMGKSLNETMASAEIIASSQNENIHLNSNEKDMQER